MLYASVAQLVEQGTENPRVVGSIPTGGTTYADLAHLVERDLAKVEVAGSIPVIRSKRHGHGSISCPLFCKPDNRTVACLYTDVPPNRGREHQTFEYLCIRFKCFEVQKRRRVASVAQLVEQRTENPCVGGSIPPGGTRKL